MTPDSELGRGAVLDAAGRGLQPARIGCTLTEVFRDVRAGDRIFFDDGKLGGLVREVGEGRLRVDITAPARARRSCAATVASTSPTRTSISLR